MKKIMFLYAIAALTCFYACDKTKSSNDGTSAESNSKYIIAVSSNAPADKSKADYLLTVNDVNKGNISLVGNGIEQDGSFRFYTTHNNVFYDLLYNRDKPGSIDAYTIDSKGNLHLINKTQSATMQIYVNGPKDLFLMNTRGSQGNLSTARWFRYDYNAHKIIADGSIDTQKLANNSDGEYALFTWAKPWGDNKILIPYMLADGIGFPGLNTKYPDDGDVALYSYPDMTLQKVIKTDKLGTIGAGRYNSIAIDEKGDAYVYSTGHRALINFKANTSTLLAKKPSAIGLIKNGTAEFDPNYYFNIKEATQNMYYLVDIIYIKDGKMLGFFAPDSKVVSFYNTGTKLGIIDLYNKTIKWTEGLPSPDAITSITGPDSYLSKDKSTVSVGLTTTDGKTNIYNIDIAKNTATKGLEVEGGKITYITKLDVTK